MAWYATKTRSFRLMNPTGGGVRGAPIAPKKKKQKKAKAQKEVGKEHGR